jgi:CheY-like chemotaxis protein
MQKKALVLVDGDLQRGDGLDESLVGEGYVVDTSVDSWQAIRKMKELHYDLAVIDLDLPPVHGVAVTGWDLGRIFRAYNPAISIVYLSGNHSKERKPVLAGSIRETDRFRAEGAYVQ